MPMPLTVWITINWKILEEMGIPDHLTCLLRNLNADQKTTVRIGYGTTDWFQIGKGICQGCILSSCFLNLCASWGWCTGTTQRDGMEREEGGGFRMGNTCIPVVDSF